MGTMANSRECFKPLTQKEFYVLHPLRQTGICWGGNDRACAWVRTGNKQGYSDIILDNGNRIRYHKPKSHKNEQIIDEAYEKGKPIDVVASTPSGARYYCGTYMVRSCSQFTWTFERVKRL